MANKPLQTIKFPGLTYTYTVPQVDSNFVGTAGQVPDSKKVKDEISAVKEDLSEMTTATAEDVGKALKAKTVTDGKVTEWEFGETGGTNITCEVDASGNATLSLGEEDLSDIEALVGGTA